MITIGIDPGITGAIAFIGPNKVTVFDLPTVDVPGEGSVRRRVHGPQLAALIRQQCPVGEPILSVLEDLSAGGMRARPGEQKGSSAQTIGSQYRTRGTIETVLEMLRLEPQPVNVRRWKNFYGLSKEKKDALARARELFPELEHELRLEKHHNRAEAVLIAHWARKKLA